MKATATNTHRTWQPKVLLDADHIRAITKGLQDHKMRRGELADRLGLHLSDLSKMLCYDRNADGWLMPKTTYVQLIHLLNLK